MLLRVNECFLVVRCLILGLFVVVGLFRLRLFFLRRRLLFGWQKRRDLRSAEVTAIVSLLSEFLSLHQSWSEKMLELETEKVRLERLRLEGSQPLSDVPLGQLRVSEDEQDADWALKRGIIDPSEYKNILEGAGLSPSDIEFM
jgi:hypothetical protein